MTKVHSSIKSSSRRMKEKIDEDIFKALKMPIIGASDGWYMENLLKTTFKLVSDPVSTPSKTKQHQEVF